MEADILAQGATGDGVVGVREEALIVVVGETAPFRGEEKPEEDEEETLTPEAEWTLVELWEDRGEEPR